MALFEVIQLYLGVAIVIAAIIILQYSIRRSKQVDVEERSAFRPLYIVSIAFMIYAVGVFSLYIEDLTNVAFLLDFRLLYYLGLAIEVILLGVASALILNSRRIYILPLSTIVITLIGFYLALISPTITVITYIIGALIPAIILLFVGIIFTYITKATKRSTSFALAFMLFTQIAGLPVMYIDFITGNLALFLLSLVLMGPAMVAFAFLRPEQKISGELIGYGISFAGPILFLANLQLSGFLFNPYFIIVGSLSTLTVLIAMGTGVYLYGRWSESRRIPTFILMLSFIFFALGHTIGMFAASGFSEFQTGLYLELLLTAYALIFLAIASLMAAGYRYPSVIPLAVFAPISIMMVMMFPTSLSEVFLSLLPFMILTILIMVLPAFVFMGVWKRMRNEKVPGRMRPFGLGLAIFLVFAIRLPVLIISFPGLDYSYGLSIVSFLIFWLAITGRLDKIAKTM
ncbi:MAG: membrane protein of unknown function [Candidatus Thorarchaeota archaeon]|nr:MAG: membrane protein of unknown function [Candidatus Thorarchaeota archaeon]